MDLYLNLQLICHAPGHEIAEANLIYIFLPWEKLLNSKYKLKIIDPEKWNCLDRSSRTNNILVGQNEL